jgi:MFS family permease
MNTAPAPSAWSPLANPVFRALWLAILLGNVGTWIHDVAATWHMADMTGSPLMVAAVQSATTLPMALLALFAGTLADIVDRRRYLIATQVFMMSVAALLALLAHLDLLGPAALLALTFALGCGAAMALPAQAAITPELVPREQLASAVALHSVGMNIARSIGPALGGLVVASLGAAWAFGLNALSFLGVVVVLALWKRAPDAATLPPEGFRLALRAGLRYARHAAPFRAVLAKTASFFVFAAATTALLPVLVRERLDGGSGSFGLLLGFIGVGALFGALLLPALRARLDRDRLVLIASLVLAACAASLAVLTSLPLLCAVMLLNGLAWIAVLSSLQIAAQTAVPGWVRARALSLYLVVFSLGLALGSLVWGALAQQVGVPVALVAASVALAVSAVWARRFRIAGNELLDHTPSGHWPMPIASIDTPGETGPVLVTIEYRIDAAGRELVLALMQDLGERRRRDGAVQWGVMEDTERCGDFLEYFLVGSWLEHLRQHERVTREEERLQTALRALHRGEQPPKVRHLVGARLELPLPPPPHSGDS